MINFRLFDILLCLLCELANDSVTITHLNIKLYCLLIKSTTI